MKKLFFVLVVFLGSCFGERLEITKIIPDLNLYVLNHTYLVKCLNMNKKVKVGHVIHIDPKHLSQNRQWQQEIEIHNSFRMFWNDDIWPTYYSSTRTFLLTPIGRISETSLNAETFGDLIIQQNELQDIDFYLQIKSSKDMSGVHKAISKVDFSDAEVDMSAQWFVNKLYFLSDKLDHKISLIYSFTEPDVLVGVYHKSTRKVFSTEDEIEGLLIFKK